MEIRITLHAKERMKKYGLIELQVKNCVNNPDIVVEGKSNRKIAQKRINGYVLRVIYEKHDNVYVVITTYKAKRERYEI
ncbi:MAG: DUF4258 domain-containing protein [Candidatus Diapherotrites archaeon]|uniref:DUF4258 domain-containing protein n=1 Tax=Candidatus Iainarchaeum sp. TaxID=3101447 RepID=A0A2D6LPW5_9ARCH|nr:DUF4258 domain-containing protein [Candidatus Diapherotrites archaeon]|tara:strand:- start:5275 stop:5511 length:237 start_codon:yes stop_codon:yes gene_type:complete